MKDLHNDANLQSIPSNFTIPIISSSSAEYTYDRILKDFYIPNIPFIITGITEDWPAQKDWITTSSFRTADTGIKENIPNWDCLSSNYGEFEVSVLQCPIPPPPSSSTSSEIGEREDNREKGGEEATYGSGEMKEMKFNDVIQLWKNGKGKGMYIKDWHLRREVKERAASGNPKLRIIQEKDEDEQEEGSFYTTPDIFKNDWMDNYYSNNTNDDFSFVYFGTEGTFTPLHRDVYTSYSWSANILGRKKWTFIPPSSIPYCRLDPSNPNSPLHPDIRPGRVDTVKYPAFEKVQVIEVIQDVGSVIWVPSNWFHCVENLSSLSSSSSTTTSSSSSSSTTTTTTTTTTTDTTIAETESEMTFVISINQNWCNEQNLIQMFKSMKESVLETEDALSDVYETLLKRKAMGMEVDVEVEWDESVQRVLELNVGWGWETFYSMIRYNLLNPPAPPHLRPPSSTLKEALSYIFADHRLDMKKKKKRAKSYDGALEAALAIMNS